MKIPLKVILGDFYFTVDKDTVFSTSLPLLKIQHYCLLL